MGRLIDADEVKKRYPIMENDFGMVINERLNKELDKIPTVEAIPKADYEARLKADMVAMLTELQMEIEEIEIDVPFGFEPVSKTSAFYEGVSASGRLIQQKIDKLKESD